MRHCPTIGLSRSSRTVRTTHRLGQSPLRFRSPCAKATRQALSQTLISAWGELVLGCGLRSSSGGPVA